MRKIAANYIFPVCAAPIKNGVVVLDDTNTIVEIIDNDGVLVEAEKTEFYNGVLVPGFTFFYRINDDLVQAGKLPEIDRVLYHNGIAALGCQTNIKNAFLPPTKLQVKYQMVTDKELEEKVNVYISGKNILLSDTDFSAQRVEQLKERLPDFETKLVVFNERIPEFKNDLLKAMKAENEALLSFFVPGIISTLNPMLFMKNLFLLQMTGVSFEKILQWITLNGAVTMQLSETFGSFEKGKSPGIVLIENFDFQKTGLRLNSKIRRLI